MTSNGWGTRRATTKQLSRLSKDACFVFCIFSKDAQTIPQFPGKGIFAKVYLRKQRYLETLAASKAVIGLRIGISFIVIFTQRFFAW
jgi:hypothetical protein